MISVRNLLVGAGLLVFGATSMGTTTFAAQCETDAVRNGRQTEYRTAYPIMGTAPGYSHDRFGTYPKRLARDFAAFHSNFDDGMTDWDGDGQADSLGVPLYVSYEMRAYRDTAGNIAKPSKLERPGKWYTEPGAVFQFLRDQPGVTKIRIDDSYYGIGGIWNRGHLGMYLHAARISEAAGCNTHLFWNAVPQAALLNQGPWLDLEYWSGAAANQYGAVWIVTGAIFDNGELEWIGDEKEIPIAVPNAMFKIIARDGAVGEPPAVIAFVFDNASVDDDGVKLKKCSTTSNPGGFGAYDHSASLVTVREVQDRTGLMFFGNLPPDARERVLDAKPDSFWPIDPENIKIGCKP